MSAIVPLTINHYQLSIINYQFETLCSSFLAQGTQTLKANNKQKNRFKEIKKVIQTVQKKTL